MIPEKSIKILVDVPVDKVRLEKMQQIGGQRSNSTERINEGSGRRLDIRIVPFAEEIRTLPESVIKDREILFCTFPPANINLMKKLAFIQIASVGYSQFLDCGLPEKGIWTANARGVFDAPIGEWCVAMMINLARDVRGMVRNQEGGIWDRDIRFQREIRGLTVGIWGYGGIGRETARLAKAMGMRVAVLVRSHIAPRRDTYTLKGTGDPEGILPDRVYGPDEKKEFLKNLDFLVVAVPLSPPNRGMIGREELRLLPERAHLLNPARGPLVQEEALLEALRNRWIAGAALDTHYSYPMPAEHPLWQFDNVIMTPHISGSSGSPHYVERIWDIFQENVNRYVKGETPLLNQIAPDKLSP